MRYQMKQHWLSFGDDFSILDSAGREAYLVKGRLFSWGDKLSLQDASGNEAAFIDQKLLSWGPTYEISRGGQHVATVKKEMFSFLKTRFQVDVPGPDDIEAEGNFLGREYSFSRQGSAIATVSKAWFSFTDTYGIDVAPGQDDALILASAVVIDMALFNRKDS